MSTCKERGLILASILEVSVCETLAPLYPVRQHIMAGAHAGSKLFASLPESKGEKKGRDGVRNLLQEHMHYDLRAF